jgi:hypothetical protein
VQVFEFQTLANALAKAILSRRTAEWAKTPTMTRKKGVFDPIVTSLSGAWNKSCYHFGGRMNCVVMERFAVGGLASASLSRRESDRSAAGEPTLRLQFRPNKIINASHANFCLYCP